MKNSTTKRINAKIGLLDILNVVDRMEIGPVKLEPRRLIAPYKVIQNGKEDSIDLIYRFEEDVFEPDEAVSVNLANMIAAQLALNYGLFCKEMIFHGLFDIDDRKFIVKMAKNTAREIFVKKFLEPNPFLTGEVKHLTPVKQDSYLQAEIVFSEERPKILKINRESHWTDNRSRHAVLSSGGKDSLLSYSLLKEIGYEVHSIFINESGRHWFTALNAYRHFEANEPNTARVWTNSDRVFAWMLRHFPFIRQDFADVRSDEYPVRLWTVAVFLFGALPILRKRGIGRLVIGDEFDTTVKTSHKGITHYDGLYDQSRYFDETLTRYYMRKDWGVSQFSILRPLSELLIEKILVEGYPDIQRHQMSCHATHKEGDRVRPCGRCEKCRRIVGMLMALDADPSNCGYTQSQVEQCLKDIIIKGIHQESAGAQHLNFLLIKKGLIRQPSNHPIPVQERPEIMKLRFDPEKSPNEAIPKNLREPLYRVFLKYSKGAVKRHGRIWIGFNPLAESAFLKPYPFESNQAKLSGTASNHRSSTGDISSPKRDYLWGELTCPHAEARLKKTDVALLPVGAIEQHGAHLPLDTDTFDADYLAKQVAATCTDPKPLVLPVIPYGVSYHHDDFKGTISISNETLSQLVYEVGMSAARNGITKLIVINGHGGNIPTLKFAAQMINRDAHIFTCVETGETSLADIYAISETPGDVHAGEIETSTALALREHLVQLDKAETFVPRFSSQYLNFGSKRSVEWFVRTAKISSNGVLGDPKKASREKGKKIWAVMVKNLVELVEDLKSMTLSEIYEKKP